MLSLFSTISIWLSFEIFLDPQLLFAEPCVSMWRVYDCEELVGGYSQGKIVTQKKLNNNIYFQLIYLIEFQIFNENNRFTIPDV